MFLGTLLIATLCFMVMITVNVLANSLPINGIQTGAVSKKYTNLFQPSGVTFSIWGILYMMMLVFLVIQFIDLRNPMSDFIIKQISLVHLLFAFSSLVNSAWLWVWHHDRIGWSTGLMLVLLITLSLLVYHLPTGFSWAYWTFSAYLGWISIAMIANITIFLVKSGYPESNRSALIVTHLVLFIGVGITTFMVLEKGNVVFALPVIWAYLGILKRHAYDRSLDRNYPSMGRASLLWIVALLMVILIELI